MTDYIEALKQGREIVVAFPDTNNNCAVFYMVNGKLHCWSRAIGEFEHTRTLEEMQWWFGLMKNRGAEVIICGYTD